MYLAPQRKEKKDLNQRIADLRSKLEKMTHNTKDVDKKNFRCAGYLREIWLGYDQETFLFAPGSVIIDRHGIISICVGVARSPDTMGGDVLWLFSEGETEIHYISVDVPEIVKRNYQLLAA